MDVGAILAIVFGAIALFLFGENRRLKEKHSKSLSEGFSKIEGENNAMDLKDLVDTVNKRNSDRPE